MGFALEVFPPTGRRMVRAIVTPTTLYPPQETEYSEGEERFVSAVRLDTWGTAVLVYDIHN